MVSLSIALETTLMLAITDLHWSNEQKMYCDVSVDDDGKSSR
jgi:hypothetical protein